MRISSGTWPQERVRLVEELYELYGKIDPTSRTLFSLRKKYSWCFVVGGTKLVKRLLDILVSSISLILLSPLFLFIAILIKITDRGTVFYIAPRVGKWGAEFACPKFRSMKVNADKMKDALLAQNDHKDSITFKMKRDPRVTWIGRIIRKLSIDELPQLWCVLKGEMSLVGPRPPLPREVAEYSLIERRRLDVVPGLTCIWQVKGRGNLPFPEQVELDIEYIKSQNFLLDIKLLFLTIPAVLLGKGAY